MSDCSTYISEINCFQEKNTEFCFSFTNEIYHIKINCRQDTKQKPLAYFTTR